MTKQKVIVGEFRYCQKAMRFWLAMGYRIARANRWSDGKYSYVLEKTT